MSFFVYILECSDGTFYTGKTINIEKRLRQHNGLIHNGARYTRTRRPVNLKYIEEFKTNRDAMKKELRIKQLSHKPKEKMCTESLKNP